MIFFNHQQGEIDACRNTCGSPYNPVAQKDRVAFKADLRISPGKFIAAVPVRDGTATIQHSGLGQQKSAAANRRLPPDPGRAVADPFDQCRPGTGDIHPAAAGDIGRVRNDAGRRRAFGQEPAP